MSFSTHVRCDWCEGVLCADDEDEALDGGWLCARVGDGTYDFCCLPCLTKWAGSDGARELVEQASKGEEE